MRLLTVYPVSILFCADGTHRQTCSLGGGRQRSVVLGAQQQWDRHSTFTHKPLPLPTGNFPRTTQNLFQCHGTSNWGGCLSIGLMACVVIAVTSAPALSKMGKRCHPMILSHLNNRIDMPFLVYFSIITARPVHRISFFCQDDRWREKLSEAAKERAEEFRQTGRVYIDPRGRERFPYQPDSE